MTYQLASEPASANALSEFCASLMSLDSVQKPFLKWAGRKTKLVTALKSLVALKGKRFIEPFVGSGAVFINTDFKNSILADSNNDIIQLYTFLRIDPAGLIARCAELFSHANSAEIYNARRNEFNETTDSERKAALFVYLNRHCFNGLCRYNKSGEFNVPFGRYTRPYFPRKEMLAFGRKLTSAKLLTQDFRATIAMAKAGDVVYCDPPYVPLSNTANFTSYASEGFSLLDQKDLTDACIKAAKRGATVLISNHDTPLTRTLYEQAESITPLLVSRTISCNGAMRQKAKELVALFRQPHTH